MASFATLESDAEALYQKACRLEIGLRERDMVEDKKSDRPIFDQSTPTLTHYEKEEIRKAVEAELVDFKNVFKPFYPAPDPAHFTTYVTNFSEAVSTLSQDGQEKDPVSGTITHANTTLALMSTVGGNLDDWTGKAAENFRNGYLREFGPVTSSQRALTAVLGSALNAEAMIWEGCRRDIAKICDETNKALDSLFSCSNTSWHVGFAVFLAIAGVATLQLQGTALALTIITAGAAGVVKDGAAPQDPQKGEIGGGSVQSILESLRKATKRLDEVVTEKEEEIAKAMRSNLTVVQNANRNAANADDDALDRSAFVIPRPTLAGTTPGNAKDPSQIGTHK